MHYLIFFFLSIFLNSRVSSLPQSKVSIDPVLYPNNTINYDISTTTNYSYNLEYLDNGNWIEDHKTLFKPFIINYNNLVDYKNDTLRYRFLFLNENEIIYSNTFKLAHIDMRYSINKINKTIDIEWNNVNFIGNNSLYLDYYFGSESYTDIEFREENIKNRHNINITHIVENYMLYKVVFIIKNDYRWKVFFIKKNTNGL